MARTMEQGAPGPKARRAPGVAMLPMSRCYSNNAFTLERLAVSTATEVMISA